MSPCPRLAHLPNQPSGEPQSPNSPLAGPFLPTLNRGVTAPRTQNADFTQARGEAGARLPCKIRGQVDCRIVLGRHVEDRFDACKLAAAGLRLGGVRPRAMNVRQEFEPKFPSCPKKSLVRAVGPRTGNLSAYVYAGFCTCQARRCRMPTPAGPKPMRLVGRTPRYSQLSAVWGHIGARLSENQGESVGVLECVKPGRELFPAAGASQ